MKAALNVAWASFGELAERTIDQYRECIVALSCMHCYVNSHARVRARALGSRPPRRLPSAAHVKDLQQKAGLKPAYFGLSASIVALYIVHIVLGGAVIINIVGFCYPAVHTFRALATGAADEHTVKQWLTYWVIFALFNAVETGIPLILSYVPFYLIMKGAFLWWCWAPGIEGATAVYDAAAPAICRQLDVLQARGSAQSEASGSNAGAKED